MCPVKSVTHVPGCTRSPRSTHGFPTPLLTLHLRTASATAQDEVQHRNSSRGS
jgi:hypothetical protein